MSFHVTALVLFLLPFSVRSEEPAAKPSLPAEWHGRWSGPLRIIGGKGAAPNTTMRLTIEPIDKDRLTWTIIYGEGDKVPVRRYEFIAGDKGPNHFVIDEKNGSLIDLRLLDGSLRGMFRVKGDDGKNATMIFTTYRLSGANLVVEMTVFPESAKRATEIESAKIHVESYLPASVQIAELTRQME